MANPNNFGQGVAPQIGRAGIGKNLYEKRGRNTKGQMMFHNMGPLAVSTGGAQETMKGMGAKSPNNPIVNMVEGRRLGCTREIKLRYLAVRKLVMRAFLEAAL